MENNETKYLYRPTRVTIAEFLDFIADNPLPPDTEIHVEDSQKPYCGSGLLYATNVYYDTEEKVLAFTF